MSDSNVDTQRTPENVAVEWSIIIPCGDDAEGVEITLKSLLVCRPDGWPGEMLVVNDGGHPAVSETVAKFPEVREIIQKPNAGSYAARNLGIEKAKGDILSFIDAGCWIDANWYDEAKKAIAQADYVAGNIIIPREICKTLGHKYSYVMEFPVENYFERDGYGPTANLTIRRKVIDICGPFDDRLRSGGDLEFGSRVRANGTVSRLLSLDMVVFHEPRSLAQIWRKQTRTFSGARVLADLYPERFGSRHPAVPGAVSFARRMKWLLRPPSPFKGPKHPPLTFGLATGLSIVLLVWYGKWRQAYNARKDLNFDG